MAATRLASPSQKLGSLSCTLWVCASVACGGDPGTSIPAPIESLDPALPSGQATSDPLLEVHVEGTGAVRSEPAGIDCPGRCAASFPAGTRVTLRAAPAEGWRVGAWGGACAGSEPCTIVVGEPVSVTIALALVDPRWDPAVGAGDCAAFWGASGAPLSPCDAEPDRYVVVRKSKRNVALCERGALVKNIRGGLGSEPVGAKRRQGDGKTPRASSTSRAGSRGPTSTRRSSSATPRPRTRSGASPRASSRRRTSSRSRAHTTHASSRPTPRASAGSSSSTGRAATRTGRPAASRSTTRTWISCSSRSASATRSRSCPDGRSRRRHACQPRARGATIARA